MNDDLARRNQQPQGSAGEDPEPPRSLRNRVRLAALDEALAAVAAEQLEDPVKGSSDDAYDQAIRDALSAITRLKKSADVRAEPPAVPPEKTMHKHKKSWQEQNQDETRRREHIVGTKPIWIRGLTHEQLSPPYLYVWHSCRGDGEMGGITNLALAISEVAKFSDSVSVTYSDEAGFEIRPEPAVPPAVTPLEVEQLQQAFRDLEEAAWCRQWTKLKEARERIFTLTGVSIVSPLRAALEATRKAREAVSPPSGESVKISAQEFYSHSPGCAAVRHARRTIIASECNCDAWEAASRSPARELPDFRELVRRLVEDCTCEFRDCAIHHEARLALAAPPSPPKPSPEQP